MESLPDYWSGVVTNPAVDLNLPYQDVEFEVDVDIYYSILVLDFSDLANFSFFL